MSRAFYKKQLILERQLNRLKEASVVRILFFTSDKAVTQEMRRIEKIKPTSKLFSD